MNTTISAELQAFINRYLADATEYCRLEAQILEHYLKAAIAQGFAIHFVWDGEERNPIVNNNVMDTLNHIFSVDECSVSLSKNKAKVVQMLVLGEGEAQTIADEGGDESALNELTALWESAVKEVAPELYNEYFALAPSPF